MSFSEKLQTIIDLAKTIVELSPNVESHNEYRTECGIVYTVYKADTTPTAHTSFYLRQYSDDGLSVAFHAVPQVTITPVFLSIIDEKISDLKKIIDSLSPSKKTRDAEIAFLKARLSELQMQ